MGKPVIYIFPAELEIMEALCGERYTFRPYIRDLLEFEKLVRGGAVQIYKLE